MAKVKTRRSRARAPERAEESRRAAAPEGKEAPGLDSEVTKTNFKAAGQLLKSAMLLTLTTESFGKTRRLDDESIERAAAALGVTDDRQIKAQKQLWDSDVKSMAGMKQLIAEAKQVATTRTFHFAKGQYLVPDGASEMREQWIEHRLQELDLDRQAHLREDQDAMDEWRIQLLTSLYEQDPQQLGRLSPVTFVTCRLRELQRQLAVEVERFNREDYAEAKARAAQKLGDQYDEADYPDKLHCGFHFRFSTLQVDKDYARRFGLDYATLFEDQQAQLSVVIESAKQKFFETMHKAVEHLRERMTGAQENGKPKKLSDSSIDNIRQAMADLKALMEPIGASDVRLNRTMQAVENMLSGVNVDQLRERTNPGSFETARQKLAQTAEQVIAGLEAHMVSVPSRRVTRGASLD